jgi:hypothetical protein
VYHRLQSADAGGSEHVAEPQFGCTLGRKFGVQELEVCLDLPPFLDDGHERVTSQVSSFRLGGVFRKGVHFDEDLQPDSADWVKMSTKEASRGPTLSLFGVRIFARARSKSSSDGPIPTSSQSEPVDADPAVSRSCADTYSRGVVFARLRK